MNGFLSRLHPATKLGCAFVVSAATPFLGIRGLLLMLGVLIFASPLGGIGLPGYRRALRPIIFLLITAGTVGLFAGDLSYAGLLSALVYSLRLLLLFLPFWMLMETTDTGELRDALIDLNLPYWLVVSIFLLLKNIQEGNRVLRKVKIAQTSRGMDLESGNFLGRLWKSRGIVIPMITWALVRSGDLSRALEARGFSLEKRPTTLTDARIGKRDVLVILTALLVVITALMM